MHPKLLKGILNFTGIVAIILYLTSAFDIGPIKNFLISDNYKKYGELTEINRIDDFKVDMPPKRKEYYGVNVADAEIICFGDSYFNHVRFENVPEGLSKEFDVPVTFIKQDNPFSYLKDKKFENTKGKFVIYETTERLLAHRFSKPFPNKNKNKGLKAKVKQLDKAIFDKEMDFKYMLKSSKLTEGLYAKMATFKFRQFGYITAQTKKYDLESKMLFFGPTTGESNKGFYYQHSEAEINKYADNIRNMANRMQKDYNLDFVFLPIPSKYSIYSCMLNEDAYNELLPKVFAALDERNIKYVDVYSAYKNDDRLLYHTTDSHWNEKGKDVCLELVADKIVDWKLLE